MHNGPWKEGRLGAVSLCYCDPAPEALSWIIEHHRAVGIRATLALTTVDALSAHLPLLVERNWDLIPCASPAATETIASLDALDHRPARGILLADDAAESGTSQVMYQLVARPGEVVPDTRLPECPTLPARRVDEKIETLLDACRSVLTTAVWHIRLIDPPALAKLGQPDHARLLRFLGDHHDRIWCAPVKDILQWHQSRAAPSR